MRERAIAGGLLLGLLSLGASLFAFASRSTGPCGKPESCPSLGAVSPHPYTGYGYALVAVGLVAIALALALAARRRVAG
jgi:hypothetical protein